jgi:hypothetical protein
MKTVMVLMLVAVLGALASAGVFMMRKDSAGEARSNRMARALALRVALSIALFLFMLFSWRMGWVQPSGIPAGR